MGNVTKWPPMQSKEFLGYIGGRGPEIVDLGPLPGPTRPRGGPGKGPGRAPARFAPILSPVDQFYKAIP